MKPKVISIVIGVNGTIFKERVNSVEILEIR